MNFLAHAYLSFGHPQIIVGNMVSDFVKGKSQFAFSEEIQKGIVLHREIDAFTDGHASSRQARECFRKDYRLYSGAILDIIYDHFLATDSKIFTEHSLKRFAEDIYTILEDHSAVLPLRFMHAFTYMRRDNWLYNYKDREGIRKSLSGLVMRSVFLSESDTAYRLFNEHYHYLKDCYREFIPDVKQFAKSRLSELNLL